MQTEGGTIIAIGKRLDTYNGFDTGVFHCTNGIFSALERVERDRESVGLTDGVQVLAAEGKVKAVNTEDASWIDVDDSAALDRAETVLIDQLKAKPNDGPVSRYINRPISTRISRFLAQYPVTPNQITLPKVRSSGIPPASRTLALLSAESPLPSRKCRLGEMQA